VREEEATHRFVLGLALGIVDGVAFALVAGLTLVVVDGGALLFVGGLALVLVYRLILRLALLLVDRVALALVAHLALLLVRRLAAFGAVGRVGRALGAWNGRSRHLRPAGGRCRSSVAVVGGRGGCDRRAVGIAGGSRVGGGGGGGAVRAELRIASGLGHNRGGRDAQG